MNKIPIPLEVWRKGDEWRKVLSIRLFTEGKHILGSVVYQSGLFSQTTTNVAGWLDWAKDAERDA